MKVTVELNELDQLIDERIQRKLESVLKLVPTISWTFEDFKKNTNFKSVNVARDFLKFPEYREYFEPTGIVIYPDTNGAHWKIDAAKMIQWLEENEADVWLRKKEWRVTK